MLDIVSSIKTPMLIVHFNTGLLKDKAIVSRSTSILFQHDKMNKTVVSSLLTNISFFFFFLITVFQICYKFLLTADCSSRKHPVEMISFPASKRMTAPTELSGESRSRNRFAEWFQIMTRFSSSIVHHITNPVKT